MIADTYIKGASIIHRAAAALKIATLAAFCTVVFLFSAWWMLAASGLLVLLLYKVAGLRFYDAYLGLKPAMVILLAIFIFQVFFSSLAMAAFVLLRFATLIMAANLVTMTTKSSEFVEGIQRLLRHAPAWVPADKIALAISLALRFIPLVRSVFDEVRTAQRARGLDHNPIALLNPLLVRTLKAGDQITDAIRARAPDL